MNCFSMKNKNAIRVFATSVAVVKEQRSFSVASVEQSLPEVEQCDICGQHFLLYDDVIVCPYCGAELFCSSKREKTFGVFATSVAVVKEQRSFSVASVEQSFFLLVPLPLDRSPDLFRQEKEGGQGD